MIPPKYEWDGYIQGWVCGSCGAVVGDKNIHNEFEEAQTQIKDTMDQIQRKQK